MKILSTEEKTHRYDRAIEVIMELLNKYFNKYKRKYIHYKWQRRWDKAWAISCHKAYDSYSEYIKACSPWYYFWNELEGLKNK